MYSSVDKSFSFELVYQSKKSRARVGKIHTPHGTIDTPNFVPVGTNGVIKALTAEQLSAIDVQLMFANTYHLLVQPGVDTIEKAGGLHSFMRRKKPIITDSGGFQVFSLAYGGVAQEIKSSGAKKHESGVAKITENGVTFRSYRDGEKIIMTPESSIAAQKKIGADIIVVFDELPPYHMDPQKLRKSFDRTHRWEMRSLHAHTENRQNQALYAVIHGGIDQQLRKKSAQFLGKQSFDGFGIGGSLGKNRDEMYTMLKSLMSYVPYDRPNHLLGIGDLPSIDLGVTLGIDTFDCSYPTKAARHGVLLNRQKAVKIQRLIHKNEFIPIDEHCRCYTCVTSTRAYLHHLFKAHELTAYTLASIHNITYMIDLMRRYREKILAGEV